KLYREFMRPQDWFYSVVLIFWKREQVIGTVSIQRNREQGDFKAADMKVLEELYPHFKTVVMRLNRLHTERTRRRAVEELLSRLQVPTILLSWDLRVLYHNAAARGMCVLWNHGKEQARLLSSGKNFKVPPPLLEACRSVKSVWDKNN